MGTCISKPKQINEEHVNNEEMELLLQEYDIVEKQVTKVKKQPKKWFRRPTSRNISLEPKAS